MPSRTRAIPRPDPGTTLAKALLRATAATGLPQRSVARMLGVSEATFSRVAHGRGIEPETKEGELALVFLRLFRSLDALVGGDQEQVRRFMHAENRHLGGVPAELVQTAAGLFSTTQYLDALRGRG